jgi:hypothetical protein
LVAQPPAVGAQGENSEAQLTEPDKCEGWHWLLFPSDIPEPRFAPFQALIDSGFHPDDDTEVKKVQLADAVNPTNWSGECSQ